MTGICKGKCFGHSPRDENLTLMRCYSCGLSLLCETFRLKVSLSFCLFCSFVSFLLSLLSWHDACADPKVVGHGE